MGDILYILFVLLMVAAVLYGSYRFSKFLARQSGKFSGGATHMKVVDRLAVGNDRFLMIVQLREKYYLVSSSAQGVEILKELHDFTLPEKDDEASEHKSFAESFKTVLEQYTNRQK